VGYWERLEAEEARHGAARQHIARAGKGAHTGFGGELFAGNDRAYYGRFVEFGTVKMAKRPFFFPAYRAHRKSAKRSIQAAVRAAAREVAGSQ
jgi:HK97 gp10 family phage protein